MQQLVTEPGRRDVQHLLGPYTWGFGPGIRIRPAAAHRIVQVAIGSSRRARNSRLTANDPYRISQMQTGVGCTPGAADSSRETMHEWIPRRTVLVLRGVPRWQTHRAMQTNLDGGAMAENLHETEHQDRGSDDKSCCSIKDMHVCSMLSNPPRREEIGVTEVIDAT